MKKILNYILAFSLLGVVACKNQEGVAQKTDAPEGVKLASFAKGNWKSQGRIIEKNTKDGVIIQDGILFNDKDYADAEYSYRFRAPEGTKEVQAWMSFRVKDRLNRYTVGLRGGNNNILYMARYADDANARFLGFAPLEFSPEVGKWYALRVVAVGKVIHVYLGDEDKPRLVIEDDTALWTSGGIGIGESYLPTEFSLASVREISADEAANFAKIKNPKQAYEPWKPSADKEKLRAENRAAYKPFEVKSFADPRTELSLNGQWLFVPSYELPKDAKPNAVDFDDTKWHTLNVPDMWVPPLAWLHGEVGFPYLQEPARGKTASDKQRIEEIKRVLGFTFDWDKTKIAWYRNYIDLPANIEGKHFELKFDAIATISKIFVNGQQVGSHVGMFGEVVCDISKQIKAGRNLVAVEVIREMPKEKKSGDVFEVAVTVEITEDMVNSLPKAFYNFSPAGIWQPVKLVVTDNVNVKDVFVKPALDSASVDVTIANDGGKDMKVDLSYAITSKKSRTSLYSKGNDQQVELKAGETKTVTIATPKITPKLWSPTDPNLYNLQVEIKSEGKVLDVINQTFGFRTVEVKGNRIYLNGNPFWLRGANHFPHAARANDKELATKFLQLSRENNVRIGRLHVGPVSEAWAEAADEVGFLFSVEGIWPWLMLKEGFIPADNLLNAWRSDWSALVKKYRNHPSIALWTVNNEMKFSIFDKGNADMLLKKWTIVDGMIKTMRNIDPTRPIVADSGYVRKEGSYSDYEKVVKANNIDDGDIDDIHRYFGWYNESFFHLFNGSFGNHSLPDRPFISQELSTGYSNDTDGLPSRVYLFNHYTPQALIGDYAFEHNNPDYFLKRQSFMTKELGEAIRRTNRNNSAGVLHFGYVTWFKDAHFAKTLEPRVGVKNLKKFLSPVMVSLELFGRHFYGGEEIVRNLYVMNDSDNFQAIPDSELKWEIKDVNEACKVIASGSTKIKSVPYYANEKIQLAIKLPDVNGRVDARLEFKLFADGKVLSENDYDIVIASRKWAKESKTDSVQISVFDPAKKYESALAEFKPVSIDTLSDAKQVLVVADLAALVAKESKEKLDEFVSNGGKLLVLNGAKDFADWRSGEIKLYRAQKGEIVVPKIPESPVFNELDPMDICWFADEGSRDVPTAATGVFQINRENKNVKELAENMLIHAYLSKPADVLRYSGAPLVEINLGSGKIIASEMRFNAAKSDPIAQKILTNIISYLSSK